MSVSPPARPSSLLSGAHPSFPGQYGEGLVQCSAVQCSAGGIVGRIQPHSYESGAGVAGRYRGCCVFEGDFLREGGMCEGFQGVNLKALVIPHPVIPFPGLDSVCGPRYGAFNMGARLPPVVAG